MVEVGKRYKVQRTAYKPGDTASGPHEQTIAAYGHCVWVHPEGRFALLEFPDGIRETFKMIGGQMV